MLPRSSTSARSLWIYLSPRKAHTRLESGSRSGPGEERVDLAGARTHRLPQSSRAREPARRRSGREGNFRHASDALLTRLGKRRRLAQLRPGRGG